MGIMKLLHQLSDTPMWCQPRAINKSKAALPAIISEVEMVDNAEIRKGTNHSRVGDTKLYSKQPAGEPHVMETNTSWNLTAEAPCTPHISRSATATRRSRPA